MSCAEGDFRHSDPDRGSRLARDSSGHDADSGIPSSKNDCRFLDTPVSGTTAKFDGTLDDGVRLGVKYGWTEEIHTEVAATHLLAALGFGADDVSMARRVRCYGCPRWPMLARQAAERLHLENVLKERIKYDRHSDFEWVSVKRRVRHSELKFGEQEGWSWNEMSAIDPARGGATHAGLDVRTEKSQPSDVE